MCWACMGVLHVLRALLWCVETEAAQAQTSTVCASELWQPIVAYMYVHVCALLSSCLLAVLFKVVGPGRTMPAEAAVAVRSWC